MSSKSPQGIFWILTIPYDHYTPPTSILPDSLVWITGQAELGAGGFKHWQIVCAFKSKCRLASVKRLFGLKCHAELSRSAAAAEYVHKLDTRIDGTEFNIGCKPFRRNSKVDWELVWTAAKSGNLLEIPANVRVVSYRTLRAIAADHDEPKPIVRNCFVFWGPTGTGKSRRAWDESGLGAYSKDPRSKFWCGYGNQEHVVLDEFRGGIDIAHILRWLDRYPVRVEIKGSSKPLAAVTFWVTSNLHPKAWYPECDENTMDALLRRLTITEFVTFNKPSSK